LQASSDTTPRRKRLTRALRLSVAGVVCWGLLIAGAAAIVLVKDNEAAEAREAMPAPHARLDPAELATWSRFPDYRNEIPVLAYHGVNSKSSYLTVTRRRFAEQLLALHTAGFHTITISQYARYMKTGSTVGLPAKPILLTFDDGRLDSYQGADKTLAKYHDTAVMFVVASWPDEDPGWALHWNELVKMQQSGRWEIQEHAGAGHTFVPVDSQGGTGEFYAYRQWHDSGLEPFSSYKTRVVHDVRWGERVLKEHIPGYRPVAFAVPYSNYGQRFTNDSRIPRYFLPFLHTQFPVVFDGDYLDEGKNRPDEIKGRWNPELAYRITQGPVMNLPDLSCRLRDFVARVPLWHEYSCLKFDRSNVPSAHSD
jgi:peptidoglycan/xylan/chitin deacetylase (PgdA/CDA1 family)